MTATDLVSDLTERHRATAERVALKFARRLPPAVTFDDLFAACWVAVWRAIDATDGGRSLSGELEPYAFRAAVNAARTFLRRSGRRGISRAPRGLLLVVLNETPAGADGPDLADLIEARGADRPAGFQRPFAWWSERLACLPPELRRVVIGHALRGESFAAIGAAEGCSGSQVQRLWAQAVRTLKAAHPDIENELRQ